MGLTKIMTKQSKNMIMIDTALAFTREYHMLLNNLSICKFVLGPSVVVGGMLVLELPGMGLPVLIGGAPVVEWVGGGLGLGGHGPGSGTSVEFPITKQ